MMDQPGQARMPCQKCMYCALQYCMPTDAPHLSRHGAFAMAMSPLLWQRFKPDRFDSYSAGMALLLL